MTSIYGSGYIADMATPADTEGCAACVTCGQPWPAAPAAPAVREPQDERDARIEALQTECDASNMEVIELTAEVAALRAEVANLTKIIDEAWGEA